MAKTYRDVLEEAFGPGFDGRTPQDLLFEMSTWCDQNGDTETELVSVRRDTIFALSTYISETCDWNGSVLYVR